MRLLKLLVAFALFFSLAVTVFAHPGKTDSKGGHTDHSTGEYHYHHGYSAHQHYDSNGDGILDCPHQFVDKTDSSSSKTETAPVKTSPKVSKTDSLAVEPDYQKAKEEAKTFGDYARDVFLFLLELYIVVGSIWGLLRLIKLIFGK